MPERSLSQERPRSTSLNKRSKSNAQERPRSRSYSKRSTALRKRSISESHLDRIEIFSSNQSVESQDDFSDVDCKLVRQCNVDDDDEDRRPSLNNDVDDCQRKWSSESLEIVNGSPRPRKRKTGFSSFSLSKFVGEAKMSLKRRTYQPNDPRQLIFAIRNRDFTRVRYVLETCPVDVNGCDTKGVTALHEASLDGQYEIVELLLRHHAHVNQTDADGLTCLDYAVFGGHFECARQLIDDGATVSNIRDGMPMYFKTDEWL